MAAERRRVSLSVEGIDIVGEVYFPEGGGRMLPGLAICHGIPSGTPADPTDGGYPALAQRFAAAGFVTLIFNFRGTGDSGGDFDMMGWAKDLEAAVGYLHSSPGVDRSRLCLMGFSGGAAVAAYVAARDLRIRKLVLCACPAEFRGLVDPENASASVEHFRRIGMIRHRDFPASMSEWMEGFGRVAPVRWVDKIAPRPLLLLHGAEDDVVQASQVERLFEAVRGPRAMVMVRGAGHKLRLSEEAMDTALRWLSQRGGQIDPGTA